LMVFVASFSEDESAFLRPLFSSAAAAIVVVVFWRFLNCFSICEVEVC
jgi:hypothetical protein